MLHELDRVVEAQLTQRAGFPQQPGAAGPAVAVRDLGVGYELPHVGKAVAAGRAFLVRGRGRGSGLGARLRRAWRRMGLPSRSRHPSRAAAGSGGLPLGWELLPAPALAFRRRPSRSAAAEKIGKGSGHPALRRSSRNCACRGASLCPAAPGCRKAGAGVVRGQPVGQADRGPAVLAGERRDAGQALTAAWRGAAGFVMYLGVVGGVAGPAACVPGKGRRAAYSERLVNNAALKFSTGMAMLARPWQREPHSTQLHSLLLECRVGRLSRPWANGQGAHGADKSSRLCISACTLMLCLGTVFQAEHSTTMLACEW